MTISRRTLAMAGIALGAAPALAQSSEEAAVARAVDALTKAMVSLDKAQLEALTAPQLSYGHSAGRIENQKEFVDFLMAETSKFRFIDLSEQTIQMAGNDAIVRHLMVGETQNRAGQVNPVRIGVLQVWQKQDGNWKLLARQAYRL
jgi:ketosteroid isomerase-like protein